MTRPQHLSTFRIPQVPPGLAVLLAIVALIGGLVLLDHAMGFEATAPAGTVQVGAPGR